MRFVKAHRTPTSQGDTTVTTRSATAILAALCALALMAVAASTATAGVTGFACIEGAGAHNTNSHCVPGSTGAYGHMAIEAGKSTSTSVVNVTNPVLGGKLFGATIELSATGVECVGCTAENKEVGGVMEVTSSGGTLTFTGVKVVGLESKCTVVGSKVEDIPTKPLKFTTTSVAGARLEPVTGTLLAEFKITGSECSVKAEGIKITGTLFAATNGATLIVNVTKASGELTLEGEKASLKSEATLKGGPGGNGVSLTTS
jgi:hypothetical protein